MSCVSTGRVGLTSEVSGFVVHEDQRLPARVARLARTGAAGGAGALQGRLQAHLAKAGAALSHLVRRRDEAPQTDGLDHLPAPESAERADAAATAPESRGRQTYERLVSKTRIAAAAGLIRSTQLLQIARERLRPADRTRDVGALLVVVLHWSARWMLRAPRWLQALTLAGIGLALAPWPESTAPTEPEPVLALSARPVDKPREPDFWKPVPGVIAAWHLEAPDLDGSARKYRARRQVNGARQDMLSWFEEPTDEGARPRNRLSGALAVEYYPSETPPAESLFVDAARRTSLVGIGIEKMSDAFRINTKFGAIEIADAVLGGVADSRHCLVFRHVAETVPMQLHGWFCGAPQRPLSRVMLGCLIDRVDLIGGSDTSVRAYFARVERARRACGSYPVAAAPTGWVDANGHMPDLKTAISDARKL